MSESEPLTSASTQARPQDQPVREAARMYERDRYLSALLAPADVRDDLVVLAAYLGEIRRIPLITRDAAVGEIRLQWWNDALSASGSPSGHPVADAVRELANRRALPPALVLAPIEGFSRELYEDGVTDVEELARYAEETDGSAIRLALAILGLRNVQDDVPGVEHAAQALTLTRLALTLPQHLAHGRLPLPPVVLGDGGDPRGAAPTAARESTRVLLRQLGDEAVQALAAFRAEVSQLDASSIAAFLPACLIEPYFKSILAPSRDVLSDVADISPLSRVTRLWLAHWRGRI